MFCTECGTKNQDGSKFCCNCGHPMGAVAAAEAPKSVTKEKNNKMFGGFNALKATAKNTVSNIDMDALKDKASKAGGMITEKASEAKEAAVQAKNDINDKLTELDRMLDQAVTEYNDVYTLMNDKGIRLFVERNRAVDTVDFVQELVNSIANRPASFDADFEEINIGKQQFNNSCAYAERELQAARVAAGGAGAGLAAGASVAFMAPTAAMWVATTFGTASTGTAIASLSGAAATNAALAWLGGGAIVAGGKGIAGGTAFLAMAGPIGWTIAGATLLSSIVLFSNKKMKMNKQKNEEIEEVKQNTEAIREVDAKIAEILGQTTNIRAGVNDLCKECMQCYGADYTSLSITQKQKLGALVNSVKSLSVLFTKTVE